MLVSLAVADQRGQEPGPGVGGGQLPRTPWVMLGNADRSFGKANLFTANQGPQGWWSVASAGTGGPTR